MPLDPDVLRDALAEGGTLDSMDARFDAQVGPLGHQVLALSQGLTTSKMHNGHRGVNHPVQNLETTKCEVTSQNHGFVVDWDSAENNPNIEITHKHLNDGTLAGIRVTNKNAFSVQYHPESSAGPNDSRYLFDQFVDNIKSYKS